MRDPARLPDIPYMESMRRHQQQGSYLPPTYPPGAPINIDNTYPTGAPPGQNFSGGPNGLAYQGPPPPYMGIQLPPGVVPMHPYYGTNNPGPSAGFRIPGFASAPTYGTQAPPAPNCGTQTPHGVSEADHMSLNLFGDVPPGGVSLEHLLDSVEQAPQGGVSFKDLLASVEQAVGTEEGRENLAEFLADDTLLPLLSQQQQPAPPAPSNNNPSDPDSLCGNISLGDVGHGAPTGGALGIEDQPGRGLMHRALQQHPQYQQQPQMMHTRDFSAGMMGDGAEGEPWGSAQYMHTARPYNHNTHSTPKTAAAANAPVQL